MKKLLLLTLSLATVLSAQAKNPYKYLTYNYHPDSTLNLGDGFNPHNPLKEHLGCLERNRIYGLDGTGAVNTKLKILEVKDRQDLFNQLSVSVVFSAHAKFEGQSAEEKGEFTFQNRYHFHKDSMTLMIKAESDYGRFGLQEYVLKPQFKSLIEAGKHREFIQKCGTHFVKRVRKKGVVAAIIRVEKIDKEMLVGLRAALESGLSISQDGAEAGAKMGVRINNFLRMANERARVSVDFWAIGGSGIRNLKGFFGSSDIFDPYDPDDGDGPGPFPPPMPPSGAGDLSALGDKMDDGEDPFPQPPKTRPWDPLKKIKTGIAQYMGSVTQKTAAPMKYYIAPMTLFGLKVRNKDRLIDTFLADAFIKYIDVENTVKRLKESLKDDRPHLPTKVVGHYESALLEHENYLEVISDAVELCIGTQECKMPKEQLSNVDWYKISSDFKVAKILFKCQHLVKSKGGLRDWAVNRNPCGRKPFVSGRIYPWKASLVLEGKFKNPNIVEGAELYMRDHKGKFVLIKESQVDVKLMDLQNGQFTQTLATMTAKENYDLYWSLLNDNPVFYLKVTEVNGEVRWHELGRFKKTGNHSRASGRYDKRNDK